MNGVEFLEVVFFIIIPLGMVLMLMIVAKIWGWHKLVDENEFGLDNAKSEKFHFESIAISYKHGMFFSMRGFFKIIINDYGVSMCCYFPISLIFQPVSISWVKIATLERHGKIYPKIIIHDSTGMYRISLIGRAAEALEKRGSQLNKMAAKA